MSILLGHKIEFKNIWLKVYTYSVDAALIASLFYKNIYIERYISFFTFMFTISVAIFLFLTLLMWAAYNFRDSLDITINKEDVGGNILEKRSFAGRFLFNFWRIPMILFTGIILGKFYLFSLWVIYIISNRVASNSVDKFNKYFREVLKERGIDVPPQECQSASYNKSNKFFKFVRDN